MEGPRVVYLPMQCTCLSILCLFLAYICMSVFAFSKQCWTPVLAMPGPRRRCHNPACEYLSHPDVSKMGSFCCKKCHYHFDVGSKAGKSLTHGDLCARKPAGGAQRAELLAPPAPLTEMFSRGKGRKNKNQWDKSDTSAKCEGPSKPSAEVKCDGIWADAASVPFPGQRAEVAQGVHLRPRSRSRTRSPSKVCHERREGRPSMRKEFRPDPSSSCRDGAEHPEISKEQIEALFIVPRARWTAGDSCSTTSESSPSVHFYDVDEEQLAMSDSETESKDWL